MDLLFASSVLTLVRMGVEQLGGLVVTDNEQRYSLFHLKFRDYLRQRVFDTEDEQYWHRRFVTWCEQHGIAEIWDERSVESSERARRQYACQHYITHLYHAKDWNKLFSVLDEGRYGKAKLEYEPST